MSYPCLYRSPTIVIDAHEWHVRVERHKRAIVTAYWWRPAGGRPTMWAPLSSWPGRLPKGLRAFFHFCQYSIHVARGEVQAGTRRASAL